MLTFKDDRDINTFSSEIAGVASAMLFLLWVRQVHFAALPYLTDKHDRVLLVATGSGICVFLSFLLQPCRASSLALAWFGLPKRLNRNSVKK